MARAILTLLAALAPVLAERYSFRVYGEREGLLNPGVRNVAQDAAGYLWLATNHGAYRFDGDRFLYMHREGLADLAVREMHGSADGAMWLRSPGRLWRYADGKSELIGRESIGEALWQSMASDSQTLWFITGAGTLAQLDLRTRARRIVLEEPAGLRALLMLRDGRLLVACGDVLCERRDGQLVKIDVPPGPYVALHEGRDGALYARSRQRVLHRAPGQTAFADISRGLEPANADQPMLSLTTDFHRRPLANTEKGVARYENGAWRAISDAQGLVQQVVRSIFVDREGGIWIGTMNGLWRWLGDGAWRLFDASEGLPRSGVRAAAQAKDASVWLTAGTAGVYRGRRREGDWRFERIPSLPASFALLPVWRDGAVWLGVQAGGLLRHDPATGASAPVEGADPRAFVNDLSVDYDGRVIAVTSRGFFREARPNVLAPVIPGREFYSVGFDIDKTLWLGGQDVIAHVVGDRVTLLTATDGVEKDGIRAIQPDTDGRIWIGTWRLSGIRAYRRRGNRLEPAPVEEDTPAQVSTFFLRRDPAGRRLWAGTIRGLATLEDGRWHAYSRAQGLLGDECTSACFLRDGTIWFATSGGLAQYAPPLDRGPAAPPLTVIGKVTDRFREIPSGPAPELQPDAADLTVEYAVLSTKLDAPTAVRYRLNGGEWRPARQRPLSFLDLGPGSYRLELAARGPNGVWHPQPAAFAFQVRPAWYQSWAFRGGAAAALALLLAAGGGGIARRRLREQDQRRLREMFDQYPGVVFLISPAGRFLMANHRFEAFAGVGHGALTGRTPREVLTPSSAENFERRLAIARDAGGPLQYQETYAQGGREVVFDIRTFPLRDAAGKIESFCVFATDVTDRQALAAERDQANQRYQSFVAHSTEAIIRLEIQPPLPVDLPAKQFGDLFYERAVIAEANQAAADQLGRPLDELIGIRYHEIRDRWHPENQAMDRRWYQNGFSLPDLVSVVKRPDGRERVLVASATGIVENGCLVRNWSTQRDITEERRLQDIIKSMARGVSAETGERFFDCLAGELARSLGAQQVFVREGNQTLAAWSGGRLQHDLPFDPAAYPPDRLSSRPLTGATGATLGLLAAVFDEPAAANATASEVLDVFAARAAAEIERLRFERALVDYRDQLRALGARNQRIVEDQRKLLAREIHDELGQQLTAIKIGLSFLKSAVKDNGRAQEDIAELAQMADDTVRTVRRLATELRPPALDQLGLAAAIRAHANEAGQRLGLPIGLSLADLRPSGDAAIAAFRIFQESLTNIARHAQASRVEIDLREANGTLQLRIADDGRGFPVDAKTSSLGLLGMRERAAAAGGTLEIVSHPGAGTCITARLPLA